VTTRLLGQLASLRQCRGLLFHHRRELKASWQEIHRAEFDLEVLRGLVREEEGAYDDALVAYGRLCELADLLDDDALRAQAQRKLAIVYGRRQQLAEAIAHARQAIAIYERIGDHANLAQMRSNLSAIYVQTRQFDAALEAGAQAYAFFVSVRDPYYAAGAGANLAEASFELGDFDGASRYADDVLELGVRQAAPYARFTLGQIALARGETVAAVGEFLESMHLAQHNDDPYMVAYARRALGQAYLAVADRCAAEQHTTDALAGFRQLDIPGEITATEQLLDRIRLL
jgi:tetratricopeptide (TPR) repeat protein